MVSERRGEEKGNEAGGRGGDGGEKKAYLFVLSLFISSLSAGVSGSLPSASVAFRFLMVAGVVYICII